MRKPMILILLTVLLLPGLCLPAEASEATGSIRVTLRSGEEPITGGTVTLYYVGSEIPEGYRLVDAYGGGIVRPEDTLSPHLAQWLAEMVGDGGKTRLLDADGSAMYSQVEEGLYLLVQNETGGDFFPILPFLLTMPYDGEWELQANPQTQQVITESPRTGQHPAPILGAMGMVLSGVGLALCVGRKRRR